MSTLLLEQLTALTVAAAALPPTHRAPRLALRMELHDFHRDRSRLRKALDGLGVESIGSQVIGGAPFALEAATDLGIAALMAAATKAAGTGALARIENVGLASPVVTLPRDEGDALAHLEAVLHPRLDAAPETALARFGAFVGALGGELNTPYARLVDGLIFVPVRLPASRAPEAGAYQPLRSLRPMGRVVLR